MVLSFWFCVQVALPRYEQMFVEKGTDANTEHPIACLKAPVFSMMYVWQKVKQVN